MKIRPLGGQVFNADRQTADITKLKVAFGNFVNVPKNLFSTATETRFRIGQR
jgi:hypothetical protein